MKIIIVLVEPENPGNIGAIARVMKNFGVTKLRLVNPQTPLTEEAYHRSVHATEILTKSKQFNSLEKAIADVDLAVAMTARLACDYNVRRTAITPKQLREQCGISSGTVALIFGRESSGLSNSEILPANVVVSIPTSDHYKSMNLSHAVAIILYELFELNQNPQFIHEMSTREEKGLLSKFVIQITPHLQVAPYRQQVIHKVFENLIGRSILSRREANTLLGFFRRIIVALGMRSPQRPAADIVVDDKLES